MDRSGHRKSGDGAGILLASVCTLASTSVLTVKTVIKLKSPGKLSANTVVIHTSSSIPPIKGEYSCRASPVDHVACPSSAGRLRVRSQGVEPTPTRFQ